MLEQTCWGSHYLCAQSAKGQLRVLDLRRTNTRLIGARSKQEREITPVAEAMHPFFHLCHSIILDKTTSMPSSVITPVVAVPDCSFRHAFASGCRRRHFQLAVVTYLRGSFNRMADEHKQGQRPLQSPSGHEKTLNGRSSVIALKLTYGSIGGAQAFYARIVGSIPTTHSG